MVGAHAQLRRPLRRRTAALLAALAVAVLVADGIFFAARPGSNHPTAARGTTAGTHRHHRRQRRPTTTSPVTTGAGGARVLSLLDPPDFDGNYVLDPPEAQTDLDGSSCLHALDNPGKPVTHGSTYLYVQNYDALPGVLELVDAYPSQSAAMAAWSQDSTTLAHCSPMRATVGGGDAGSFTTTLHRQALAPLNLEATGAAAVVYKGSFDLNGLIQDIQIAAVAGHDEVLLLVQLDRDPPAPVERIYDNFGSAVVTAYGKLA